MPKKQCESESLVEKSFEFLEEHPAQGRQLINSLCWGFRTICFFAGIALCLAALGGTIYYIQR